MVAPPLSNGVVVSTAAVGADTSPSVSQPTRIRHEYLFPDADVLLAMSGLPFYGTLYVDEVRPYTTREGKPDILRGVRLRITGHVLKGLYEANIRWTIYGPDAADDRKGGHLAKYLRGKSGVVDVFGLEAVEEEYRGKISRYYKAQHMRFVDFYDMNRAETFRAILAALDTPAGTDLPSVWPNLVLYPHQESQHAPEQEEHPARTLLPPEDDFSDIL